MVSEGTARGGGVVGFAIEYVEVRVTTMMPQFGIFEREEMAFWDGFVFDFLYDHDTPTSDSCSDEDMLNLFTLVLVPMPWVLPGLDDKVVPIDVAASDVDMHMNLHDGHVKFPRNAWISRVAISFEPFLDGARCGPQIQHP